MEGQELVHAFLKALRTEDDAKEQSEQERDALHFNNNKEATAQIEVSLAFVGRRLNTTPGLKTSWVRRWLRRASFVPGR